MSRPFARLGVAIALSCVAASSAVAAPAPTYSFKPFADGIFGCNINITAKNESDKAVVVNLGHSKSKIRLGLWNTWNNYSDWTVNKGGAQESKVVELSMSCNSGDRTYEFKMSSGGSEKVVKFPANGDFTGATTIGLGNIGRHF
ncbi:MAG: hypothetical protein IT353_21195 [Gemmatimonadaceae bacterium]|nr:hypothetical protein [Gemmatimonadaceae bacterium]